MTELTKTKEQLAEDKKVALELRLKPLELEGSDLGELRKKAADLWDQIQTLESEKYDLEERRKRQDYDVSHRSITHGPLSTVNETEILCKQESSNYLWDFFIYFKKRTCSLSSQIY